MVPEVYAAREKVGVYIPKERYQQEEAERKVYSALKRTNLKTIFAGYMVLEYD